MDRTALNQVDARFESLIDEILATFNITDDDAPAVANSIHHEFQRRLPDFMKIAAIAASLPAIQKWVLGNFLRRGNVPFAVCEELAEVVGQRIFESLCGRWPRRKVRVWVATIAKNELNLHFRKKAREEKTIGRRAHCLDFEAEVYDVEENDALERLLIELPDVVRAIFDRRLAGEDWTTIEAELEISEAAARKLLEDFQRPFAVSSGRRKKSRRKRS